MFVRSRVLVVLAFLGVLVASGVARGHPGLSCVAAVRVEADGEVVVRIHHDALAFALNDTSQRIGDEPMLELLAAPAGTLEEALLAGRERLITLTRLRADGVEVPVSLEAWPTAEQVRAWLADNPNQPLPVKLEFVARARLPVPTRAMTLRLPEVLGDLILTIEPLAGEPLGLPVPAGSESPELVVNVVIAPEAQKSGIDAGAVATPPTPAAAEPAVSGLRVAASYVVLGFTHIIPHGPDHALFVLGLFLLSPRLRPVLVQISAFTLAHTVTLGLTVMGLLSVPAWIVEPAIALSIVLVGVENLLTTRMHPWRPALAFAFGLLHGMGFA
ncbi:MAG: HupE/UreJ family protein, partial [Phycisphaerales bacterium]|nr:HupE/UreJ family protein [Phycisphaerales bacterium]